MARLWLTMALLAALAQCQLCGSGHPSPSPQSAASRMSKSQLELAKELLRIFNLQHVLAPRNASQRVELNFPNGTRSFVPSNPYWLLMNQTLRVSDSRDPELGPPNANPPGATSTAGSNLIPRGSEEAFVMGPQPGQDRASKILSSVKAATTSAEPVYVPSPGHRIIQRADLRRNTTLFKPPPMQRFTFEDAPRSRPLWHTLQQESMTEKIERAKSAVSLGTSVNRSRTNVRSGEVDLDPSASSDLRFQPAMRIITSPANSVKHQLPATYNHAFVVLGQPAVQGNALPQELSRSEVSALGAAFGDLIQGSESAQQPRRGRRYEHVFNIGGKPVLRAANVRATDLRLQLKPVTLSSKYGSPQRASSSAKSMNAGVSYLGVPAPQMTLSHAALSKLSSKYSIPYHASETVAQKLKSADNGRIQFETRTTGAQIGFLPMLRTVPKLASNQRGPPRNGSVYAHSRFLSLEKLGGPSQWIPIKKSFVKRDTSTNHTLQSNSTAGNASIAVSPLLDDNNTARPGPRWRGIFKSTGYYKKLNLTTLKMVSRDTFPNAIFATGVRRGPASSISPFDMAPIGSAKRVTTIYGKATDQAPIQPTKSAQSLQDPSDVKQSVASNRRSDESDSSRLKYKAKLSDNYSERELRRPDRKDVYLQPARAAGLRADGGARRPPVDSSPPVDTRFDPRFEPKYDPEFERSRFLKPPPLFPERLPERPRYSSDDAYPRVRDDPALSPDHHHLDKPFAERGYPLDRGFSRNKEYPPQRGFSAERGFPPDRGFPPERGFHPGYPPDRGVPHGREFPTDRGFSRDRYPPDRGHPPGRGYPRQDYASGKRHPAGETGRVPGSLGDDEDDPSRFDELAAWKHLSRPPIPGGFPGSFMPMGFGYPPLGGPQFGGGAAGGGGGLGQGIGTILPVKKPKFKLLGTFRSPLSLFGGGQQGWYCPCNYYPPAGRFVTSGFPNFWGGLPAGG